MAYKKKTWHEKMNVQMEPEVKVSDKKFADIPEGASMLIATPLLVDAYIRNIPKGVHTSLQQMRKDLAAENNAEYSCPVTTGIFLRIVAETAYEDFLAGKPLKKIAPFWRMVDHKAPLAKKLSFGTEFVEEQRRKEELDW